MTSKRFAIITGGNSGLGLHLAKALYIKTEFSIIIACRNKEKAENAVEEVINCEKDPDNNSKNSSDKQRVRYAILDLVKTDSIKQFVQEISLFCPLGSLSLLVNNAGIMNHPYELTPEGIEIHFATNYLGHFLLTNLLMEYMAPDARILNVTSSYYEKVDTLTPSSGG
ncbi:short chain dehydrogenase domain-containing protein [Ditylenchus destructor]|uniref:Short chain dehydrogenase domain-containing protein n=1 Tax=Ditylenchus destructor TaxID=166010 RepID=A0AAD4NIX6_9BILA|nr:short chain dehydrogenase domain-containing protein [Ditylenchus destructor]